MLDVSQKRAANLASIEGWRRQPDTRPARYSYADVLATYRRRTTSAPPPEPTRSEESH